MPEKKNANSNILLVIALGAVFCCLMIFSVIKILHIKDTRYGIDQEEQANQENQIKLQQLRQLSKREDEFNLSLLIMNNLLPDQADESQIINQIQSMSNKLPVNFIEVQFGDWVVNNNINIMPFTLRFSGDYKELIELIGNISSGERLIRIDEISIAKSEEVNLNADIKARAFYR